MPSRKKGKAAAFNPAEVAHIAKTNPYIQRLIEDASLRDNVRTAVDSAKSAFNRLSNGKAPGKALLDDKKLQADLRTTANAVRDVTVALTGAPKRRARRGRGVGRLAMLAAVGGGIAVAVNEKVRSKVLDALFGAEEEFSYTPPPGDTTPAPPAAPVSAA